jgi:flagellar biosynthesis protein FlhF
MMKIRRFEATDMQEAIAQIKRDLGPDALVVSSRPIRRGLLREGVEVMAAIEAPEKAAPPVAAATSGIDGARIAQLERLTQAMQLELRSLRSLVKSLKAPISNDRHLATELKVLRNTVQQLTFARTVPPHADNVTPLAPARLAAGPEQPVSVLVGPAGVGKTTTIAKLAATQALVEGQPARIISLDAFAPGGLSQLENYADAMGVQLISLSDPKQLGAAVGQVAANERVYVDTPGCGPDEARFIHDLARGLADVPSAEVHMVVPAGMAPAVIDTCAQRFGELGLHRLVLSKVDEAGALAELVQAPSRLSIPVSYLTTGQRVPEDLEAATEARLRALSNGPLSLTEKVA